MKEKVIFPGSFDPITIGHLDLMERASSLFDQIIVAIGNNSNKEYMFSLEKRIKWIEEATAHIGNIQVVSYEGMTIEFCLAQDVRYLLRGLRSSMDFEFEKVVAHTNRGMSDGKIDTVFLLNSPGKSYISSSIVREIIRYGGNFSSLVPKNVRI